MAATNTPYHPKVRCAAGNVTLAQINANSRAGTVVVKAAAGKTIKVVDVWMRNVGSDITSATAIVLEDTAGTDVMSTTVATFNSNAFIRAGASGSTVTNLGVALGKGAGLRIGCTVGDYATGTGMDYTIFYITAD